MQPHPFPAETIVRAKNLSKTVCHSLCLEAMAIILASSRRWQLPSRSLPIERCNKQMQSENVTRKASRKILVCSGAGHSWKPGTVKAVFYQQVCNTYDIQIVWTDTEPLFKPPRVTHSLVNYQVHLGPTLERKIRRGSMLMRNERTYLC